MMFGRALFAFDVGGCLSFLLPLIGVIIWVLSAIMKNVNKAPPPAPRAGAAQRRPAAAVDQEIEAFLRRAAQNRGGQQPAAPQQQTKTRQAAPPPLPQGPRPVRKLARTDEDPPSHESIQEHVTRHVNTDDVGQRADHLVKVDKVAAELAEHVHHSLDHRIGQLGVKDSESISSETTSGVTGIMVSTAGAGVAQLLSGREQLRNAIILNEILQPPRDHWPKRRKK